MEVYNFIREALINRQSISCIYKDHVRLLCPHILGTCKGIKQVLCYQIDGTSTTRDGKGHWDCMKISKMRNVMLTSSEWITPDDYNGSTTKCIDKVDIYI